MAKREWKPHENKNVKSVVDSIIDAEIVLSKHKEKVTSRLDVTGEQLRNAVDRLLKLSRRGAVGIRQARRVFAKIWVRLALEEFIHDVGSLVEELDSVLVDQVNAVARLDVPVASLPIIQNEDLKARETEKALEKHDLSALEFKGVPGVKVQFFKKLTDEEYAELKAFNKRQPLKALKTLKKHGIYPDVNVMRKEANASMDKWRSLLESGRTPDAVLSRSLNSQMESRFKRMLNQEVNRAAGDFRINRLKGVATNFVWVARLDSGTCESCEPRHGQVKKLKDWTEEGMPGSEVLICQVYCRCQLVPDSVSEI